MQNVQGIVFIWTQTCRETFKSAFSVPLRLIHNRTKFYHSKELSESCEILNLYRLNLLDTVVFIHKIKNRTACHHSLKNLSSLLIRIQHVFQAGIIGNHKLHYANVDFEFPSEIYEHWTTYSEVREKKFNRLLFLKLRWKAN